MTGWILFALSTGLLVGLIVGTGVGLVGFALCFTAGRADEQAGRDD